VRIERTVGDSPVQRNRVTAPVRLALPDQPARYACFAVDEQGNEWATGPGRDAPLTWAAPATAATAASADSPMGPATGRPLWRNPWIWGSAAGATLATGVVFGLLARSDRNEFDDLAATSGEVEFTAAEEVLDRGKSRATIANVLFATGGALAIATAVFIWTAPADHERTGVSAIGVGPGGLTISGSF
ncbi:MAG: hypothetical protein KJO07_15930, partial [Deltaproteobacteria bacterium]|nr:hypothetical protein [Deltaproteobacteria bacterium]